LKSDVRVLVWMSWWHSSHSPDGASCTSCSRQYSSTNNSNQVFTFSALSPLVGDRKDIRSVKVGCWFVVETIWLKVCSISTNAYVRTW